MSAAGSTSRSQAKPAARSRPPAALLAAAALALGCTVPPPRAAGAADAATPAVAAASLPASAVASQVTLQGRSGPVPAAVRARDLERLRAEGKPALLQRQLAVLAAAGEADLYRGNTARLLVDGPATFAAMKAAIDRARHRVLLESYIFEDDGVAAEFAELLLRKAAAGVHVALMYDAVGSFGSDPAFFDRLRAGGVAVCEYNPVNPVKRPGYWGVLERNHRKMLAVDGDVAYTGGINISNVYSSGPGGSRGGSGGGSRRAKEAPPPDAAEGGWRDTQVELRGPAVAAMATLFRVSWASQGCKGELPPAPPPGQVQPGQRVVKVVAGDPKLGVNPTYSILLSAVEASVRSVHLTMAYFAPGPDLVKALCDAAARGVEVSLVLPGKSDVKLVLHAARSYYAQLLEAGVRIHEMQHTVMHAKTFVVDGVLSTVGSSNLDWRSILGNAEIDIVVLGDDFGQEMEALFDSDVAASQRIDPGRWQQRGVVQRLLQGFGRLVERWL